MLSGAAVAGVDGGTVVLTHESPALVQRLAQPQYVEAVRLAIQAVLGGTHDVRWETGAAWSRSGDGGGGRTSGPGRESGPGGRSTAGRGSGNAQAAQSGHSEAPRFTRRSQTRAAQSGAPGSDDGTTPTSTPNAHPPASQTSGPRPAGGASGPRPAPPDDDIPLPDGPDHPDDPGPLDHASDYPPVGYDAVPPAPTPEEEREMLAESARPVPAGDRRDPDEVALELLRSELGATRLEG
jgi:DNA polymerase-3 subunit gamma/tau